MSFREFFFNDLIEDNRNGELGDKAPADSKSTSEQLALKEAAMAFAISDSFKKELTDIAFGKKAISSQAQSFIRLLLQNPKLSSLQSKKATLKRVIFDVDFKKHFLTEEEAIADGLTSYVSKIYYVGEDGHLIKEASHEEAKKFYDKINKSKASKANKATKSNK